MKAQTQKTITLNQITSAIAEQSLADARARLADSIGASLIISGTVEKVAKRSGLRLVIIAVPSNGLRSMTVFANFTAEAELQKAINAKIRKGSSVQLSGKFRSFGESAIVLDECRLI